MRKAGEKSPADLCFILLRKILNNINFSATFVQLIISHDSAQKRENHCKYALFAAETI